jgi:hypothetical protein
MPRQNEARPRISCPHTSHASSRSYSRCVNRCTSHGAAIGVGESTRRTCRLIGRNGHLWPSANENGPAVAGDGEDQETHQSRSTTGVFVPAAVITIPTIILTPATSPAGHSAKSLWLTNKQHTAGSGERQQGQESKKGGLY